MTKLLRSPCADDCTHPDHATETQLFEVIPPRPRTESEDKELIRHLSQRVTALDNALRAYLAHIIETEGYDYLDFDNFEEKVSEEEYAMLVQMSEAIYQEKRGR
jgi:LPS sulfotransferase NodH